MNKIEKFIRKLSSDRQIEVAILIKQIVSGNWFGLNVKKLQGKEDLFRVRRGNIRVIFSKDNDGVTMIKKLQYKNDNTYKF